MLLTVLLETPVLLPPGQLPGCPPLPPAFSPLGSDQTQSGTLWAATLATSAFTQGCHALCPKESPWEKGTPAPGPGDCGSSVCAVFTGKFFFKGLLFVPRGLSCWSGGRLGHILLLKHLRAVPSARGPLCVHEMGFCACSKYKKLLNAGLGCGPEVGQAQALGFISSLTKTNKQHKLTCKSLTTRSLRRKHKRQSQHWVRQSLLGYGAKCTSSPRTSR